MSTSLSSRARAPHEVLGVPRHAPAEQVKAAYRDLAMRHHPDRNPDEREHAEQSFKEISHAFEQLSSPEDAGARGRPRPSRGPMTTEQAEQLFWKLFGVRRAPRPPPIGDIPTRLMNWQQYGALLDSLDEASAAERLRSGLEARMLYRDTLRELRGIDAETASSVRAAAHAQIIARASEQDVECLRNLVVDGRHSLEQLRRSLGVAVIRQPADVERINSEQAVLQRPAQCSGRSVEAEAAWALFVSTKLVPALGPLHVDAPSAAGGRARVAIQ